ncbi:MAG: hypothetical protein BWX86_02257 [Verrucomicrobia bacterium ADurb.Bin122]|nr:MAG: hypothetical protein BWX86_02257 [Verrucomicrobia bacterium ADurb.Bin122]
MPGAEFGDVEFLSEEAAVDVGEWGEFGVEIDGPFVAVAIKGLKELGEAGAEVGAIAPGSLDETREGVPLEDVGIFGEEAEEHADKKTFEVVAGVADLFEFVVKIAEEGDGLQVDLGLSLEELLLLVADEGEVAELVGKVGESELGGQLRLGGACRAEALEVVVDLLAEIVEDEVGEIGNEDPPRALVGLKVFEVLERLVGCALIGREVAAGGLHLDEQFARPE